MTSEIPGQEYLWESLPSEAESLASVPRILRVRRQRLRPERPTTKNRPKPSRGPIEDPHVRPPAADEDPELWAVHRELTRLDSYGERTGYAIREALD